MSGLSQPRPTASVSAVKMHMGAAKLLGLPIEDLLDAAGLRAEDLADAEARIDMDKAVRLIRRATQLCPKPSYGLFVGENFHPTKLNLVGYLVLNAETLLDAFTLFQRYQQVIGDAFLWTSDEVSGGTEFYIDQIRIPEISVVAQEFSPTALLISLRVMAQHAIVPLRAQFAHSEPTWRAEYNRIFACPIEFEATRSGFVIRHEDLNRPVIHADPSLKTRFEQLAETALNRLAENVPTSRRVAQALLRQMPGEEPEIESIAKSLAVSVRALQAALQDEGTSFKKLVGRVRQDLAENYLRDTNLSIAEVSFLVGFSEPSAFHRAFKRWTGQTPSTFRAACA